MRKVGPWRVLRWGAVLTSLASCAAPAPSPPPPPPTVVPQYRAELALEARGVGLSAADLCPGTLSGGYIVRGPAGVARAQLRDVQVAERVCVEGLGSDGECRWRPLVWIQLGPIDLSAIGEYRVEPEALELSCAPGRLTVAPARGIVLVAGGPLIPLGETDPLPKAPPPPPSPPRPNALAIRQRLSGGPPPHRGHLEGLWLPIRAGGRTPWGALHAAPNAPAAFLSEGYGPQWIEAPSGTEAPAKAQLIALELADPTGNNAAARGGLAASSITLLNGAAEPEDLLADADRRWRAYAAVETATLASTLRRRLDSALGAQGERFTKPHSSFETLYRPTWSAAAQALIVRYVERHERTARAMRGQKMQYCPPNRPPAQCRSVTTHTAWTAHATFALELTYDRSGRLSSEERYPPQIEVHEAPE